ncbi:MAG: metal dependent phosphohydrolase [Candidatus Eremiobacteraeota bacterium]|nr:metal dependent phosphohydrolase [Candidatus Eremiobacteraeota bacterium]
MTVPFDAASPSDGAFGLYSAVGDALAGRRLGFGVRRAALAANFARHRGADESGATANWAAGLLAEIGLVAVVVPADAVPRTRLLGLADAPLYGARIVAGLPGLPARTSDIVRWHREHDDGTGFPDRLRWDGIPADAASLGIANAFVEAIEDPEEPRDAAEALFAILAENGRRFRVELVRAFREFIMLTPLWDARWEPVLPASDDDALLEGLAEMLDARAAHTAGRTARVVDLARSLATRLDLDERRVVRAARLLALGAAGHEVADDRLDPLSRFARDRRATVARHAAAIAQTVAAYRDDAPLLGASSAWHEDGTRDPLAAVLALAIAVDAIGPNDGPRLVAAAAGTQFDPDVARVYLSGTGAPT